MEFVHQALTWGFLLALAVPLIHLINLVRRRRVKWAAMDFLIQSHRRRRTWVWLTQLLLMLLRMAAILLLVAMLAQWITQQEWLSIFGGQATHHYVVLDDSYSMSDRVGATTAFDRAKQVMGDIASQAMAQETRQRFTLVRYSHAARWQAADEPPASRGAESPAAGDDANARDPSEIADLNGVTVRSDFDLRLENVRRDLDVTELSTGPLSALQVVEQMIKDGNDERAVVYVLTDFREKDWKSPAETAQALDRLSRAGSSIQLVSCTDGWQSNLAVVDIQPADNTRAAGVPLFVNVTVKNFGRELARKVPLKIRTYFYDPQMAASSEPGSLAPKEDEPPAVVIDEIEPGGTVTSRVQVYFPQPGKHVVDATLPDDAVEADNRRWCVVDLPDAESVLVIDGSPTQQNAYYLQAAFQPGQRANTGVRPNVQPVAFLRDATLETLTGYSAVYLLDVDRFDARVVAVLEEYVRRGGGIGFFLGDQTNITFYNEQLYRGGEGLFPVELERSDLLPAETFENAPDFEVTDHPIFQVFLGDRNPLLKLVTIERFMKPTEVWTPSADETVEVTARLRNQQPLAVERRFGDGRVVAFLTTLAPQWNNWAYDPSFVVTLLQLQTYLAAPGRIDEQRLVGSPLEIAVAAKEFSPEVIFVTPGDDGANGLVVKRTAVAPAADSPLIVASLDAAIGTASEGTASGGTAHRGVYEVWPRSMDGRFDVRRYALNTDPLEGDLQIAPSQSLLARLEPARVEYREARQFAYDFGEAGGVNRSLLLMGVLVGLLLLEQWIAYSASYHPATGVARA